MTEEDLIKRRHLLNERFEWTDDNVKKNFGF